MHLSRQLAAFIRAGIPILDAVHTLGDEATNTSVKRMMADVEAGLRGGETMSDCLDRHPKIFPDFYRGILRSAELTGQLDTVLDQLATYLERDLDARRKVKAAMIYPSIIAGMSIVTVVVLATFVLPRFKTFFASLNAKLPLPTRILLAVTNFLTQWWWALLVGLAVVALLVTATVMTEGGRHARDRLALALPVLGDTIQFALVERFCRILASMANAGVALPEALRVATASLRNLVYTRALAQVGEAMLEGEGLAKPIADSHLFPSTAAQMMRVGEDTVTVDTQLEVAARYYARELDYKIKRLTALFEPLVIIVMGLIVGFVAIALVSAMYGIYHQVKT
jgi:type IV pilus assembly protein PilC